MNNTCCIIKWCVGGLLCLVLGQPIQAQLDQIPITPFGLGGATIAAAFGAESALHNPAGVMGVSDFQIEMAYADSFSEVQSGWVSLGKRLFANTVVNLAMPVTLVNHEQTIENSVGQAETVGTFQDIQGEAVLSVASELKPGVTMGMNGKYYFHHIATDQASGFAVDLGAQYYTDWGRFGVIVKDIGGKAKTWSTGRQEMTPMSVGLGTQIQLPFGLVALGDVSFLEKKQVINLGMSGKIDSYITLFGGVADMGVQNTWRAGMSLNLSGTTLRYAMSVHDTLGVSYRFGLCFMSF